MYRIRHILNYTSQFHSPVSWKGNRLAAFNFCNDMWVRKCDMMFFTITHVNYIPRYLNKFSFFVFSSSQSRFFNICKYRCFSTSSHSVVAFYQCRINSSLSTMLQTYTFAPRRVTHFKLLARHFRTNIFTCCWKSILLLIFDLLLMLMFNQQIFTILFSN